MEHLKFLIIHSHFIVFDDLLKWLNMQSANYWSFGFNRCLKVSGSSSNELCLTKSFSFLKGFYLLINKLIFLFWRLSRLASWFRFDSFSDIEWDSPLKDKKNLIWLIVNIIDNMTFLIWRNRNRLGHISNYFCFHFFCIVHETLKNIKSW